MKLELVPERCQKVLLVDDDLTSIIMLKHIANKFNYEYEVAENAEQALDIILRSDPRQYCAVITDIVMPGMSGLDLLRKVKKIPDYAQVPFILQTSSTDDSIFKEGLEEGAYYFLNKPLNVEIVGKVLGSAVRDLESYSKINRLLSDTKASFSLLSHAEFTFRTIYEAQKLASTIAQLSFAPAKTSLGLFELMENAVEHGNLGITYDEKSELIESHSLIREIERRHCLPINRDKTVTVRLECHDGIRRVEIVDMGDGFDYSNFLEFSPERLTHTHGRGIMIANTSCFSKLEYLNGGNTVVCDLI